MLRSVAVFESAGIGAVVEAQELLRGVGQQIQEAVPVVCSAFTSRFPHHLQGLVVAASGDAGRAALAQIADKNREDAASSGDLRSGELKMAFTFW
jgi:hypothetical protein